MVADRLAKRVRFVPVLAAGLSIVSACAAPNGLEKVEFAEGQKPVLKSSEVSRNVTPSGEVLSCYKKKLGRTGLGIAVGDIRDYTGKQSDGEGFAITQGGALMAYSALGKLSPAFTIHERFDTRIADVELHYSSKRQLGDGRTHPVDGDAGAEGEKKEVPWKPYYGGSVLQSDYYIVGGITELNYNITSGGAEVAVNNVGGKRRSYTMNVAVDLRLVGSQSLKVADTVSLQKQVTGYEVGAGVFRFFGMDLIDINTGAKEQEPLQLGVRTAIELGVVDLLEGLTNVSADSCRIQESKPNNS
jgi:curli biogenesis system outer membrane secretion channel CsgG